MTPSGRGRTDLSRRSPVRESRRLFLILSEGDTEEDYFKHVRRRLNHPQLKIELFGETGMDPLYYVKQAVRERDAAVRKGSAYDEVWCVFDVDQHQRLTEALDLARRKGIRVALSSPSFEIWLLWHFDSHTAHIAQVDLDRKVRRHLPGFDKRLAGYERHLEGRSSSAIERAHELDRKHEGDRSGEGTNPSSKVHSLIDSVRDSLQRFAPGSTPPYP